MSIKVATICIFLSQDEGLHEGCVDGVGAAPEHHCYLSGTIVYGYHKLQRIYFYILHHDIGAAFNDNVLLSGGFDQDIIEITELPETGTASSLSIFHRLNLFH